MLTWAKVLGAQDLPSLYAMKKTGECIKKLLGNPTEKVSAPAGNMFYLNSISKAIAMVCGAGLRSLEFRTTSDTFLH